MYRAIACLVLAFAPLCGQQGEPLTKYFVAFLYKGQKFAALSSPDDPIRKKNHEEHIAFIQRMRAEGKMLIFGPILEAGDLRGMYVFKAETIEQAKEWANQEPSVKIGLIEMRVYPWLGAGSLASTTQNH